MPRPRLKTRGRSAKRPDMKRPIILAGAGRMGLALLRGWIANGLAPRLVVFEPEPSPALVRLSKTAGVALNPARSPSGAEALILAMKPQGFADAAKTYTGMAKGGTVISILAGTRLRQLERVFGSKQSIIRAMPNQPASIGRGITVITGNKAASTAALDLAARLLVTSGAVVSVRHERLMDPVTAVSGSGPAYLFLLTEALAQAGVAAGLSAKLSAQLARATVAGAAAMLDAEPETPPEALRARVTSKGGTTEAALAQLLAKDGLPQLLKRAVLAAMARAKALAR